MAVSNEGLVWDMYMSPRRQFVVRHADPRVEAKESGATATTRGR